MSHTEGDHTGLKLDPKTQYGAGDNPLRPLMTGNRSRSFWIASELLNMLLVTFLLPVVLGAAQTAASSSLGPSGMLDRGPEFKVEYGYIMIPALDCPGGRCRQPSAKRLKIQSLEKQPIAIKDVVVNERPECTDYDKSMGPLGGIMALIAIPIGIKGKTMSFGDMGYVLSPSELVKVRIVTDKGESTYGVE